ncbi:DUF1120 domain-containing protein [Enterobacter roggenkampii]
MKDFIKTIISISLSMIFMSAIASASEAVDLIIQATAVTGSCNPALDSAVIDLGTIKYGTLSSTLPNELPGKNVNLTITCSSPMSVGWTVVDNHQDSVSRIHLTRNNQHLSEDALAGLGKTSSGLNIGVWDLHTDSVEYDGVKGNTISSVDNGVSWRMVEKLQRGVSFGGGEIVSVSDGVHISPVSFNSATFKLNVNTTLATKDSLKITDDTKINGSATISIVYL